jgi:hypothetical protein
LWAHQPSASASSSLGRRQVYEVDELVRDSYDLVGDVR